MTSEPAGGPAPGASRPAPLPPGAVIGILGGGQLGRMLAMAAHRLGYRAHIFCPDPDSPAFDVTDLKTVAAYNDIPALGEFAKLVSRITWEFENVPAAAIDACQAVDSIALDRENRVGILPPPAGRLSPLFAGSVRALSVAQDRLGEKRFVEALGLAPAPFHPVDSLADLEAGAAALGLPAILKTRRLGYDGKGQQTLRPGADLAAAFAALGGAPAVLEAFIPFEREISVILARGADGAVAAYDPVENVHENHILRTSTVPAAISPALARQAVEAAAAMAGALDYVGVIGVEFFVAGGRLLVNELAPRVHNSGHWTEAACAVSQFDQHIRAVAGWPLGDPSRFADAVTTNLIGEEVRAAAALGGPGAALHLYGKRDIRPGRKMGHLTRLAPKSG